MTTNITIEAHCAEEDVVRIIKEGAVIAVQDGCKFASVIYGDMSIDVQQVNKADINSMDFGRALGLIKKGLKLTRGVWNGKGMFVFLVNGSTFEVNRAPLLGIYPEGTKITYNPHIDMCTADGSISVWAPSMADVLATDWRITV